jgi:hypothetical protein
MAPLLAQGLPRIGVVRSLKRDVVYGPVRYHGLGISCLFTFQMTEHIVRILKYGTATNHLTGQLIRHTLEATKLEIGCEGPLLMKQFRTYSDLITPTWLTQTWQFLSNHNMQIDDSVADLSLDREHDQFIIRAFQQAGYKGKTLGRLNKCRVFLHATTVSNISTGCGKFVTQAAWMGRADTTRMEKYDWPNQGNPTSSDWKIWQEAVTKSLCIRPKILRTQLGRWLQEGSTTWLYSELEERLYHTEGGTTTYYSRAPGNASRAAKRKFHNRQQVDQVPQLVYQATVEIVRTTVYLTGWAPLTRQNDMVPTQLSEMIHNVLHKDTRWAVESCEIIDNGHTIAEAIRNGTAVGVSDGSFKDQFGTAFWILQGKTADSEMKGPCTVPGSSDVQSAYRSELAGLYGMITMVNAICAFHKIETGAIELGCDGIQAPRHVDQRSEVTNPRMAQFDLLSAARNALRICPVTVKMRHVKGHQDDHWDTILDRWASLNVEADDGAKRNVTVNNVFMRNYGRYLLEE